VIRSDLIAMLLVPVLIVLVSIKLALVLVMLDTAIFASIPEDLALLLTVLLVITVVLLPLITRVVLRRLFPQDAKKLLGTLGVSLSVTMLILASFVALFASLEAITVTAIVLLIAGAYRELAIVITPSGKETKKIIWIIVLLASLILYVSLTMLVLKFIPVSWTLTSDPANLALMFLVFILSVFMILSFAMYKK